MAWALLSVACSGVQPPRSVSYPPRTTLELSSARCHGSSCRCRPLDGRDDRKEWGIRAPYKRFEFRLPRSTSALWVEIKGYGVFFKPPERADPACFYVDLQQGQEHAITLHGEQRDLEVGLRAGLTIHEYGVQDGPQWYRSFHLSCGVGASPCTEDEVLAWARYQKDLPRGVLDPCGSVRVQGARFGGSHKNRNDTTYQRLTVHFQLKVYTFAPHRPPGAAECVEPVRNR